MRCCKYQSMSISLNHHSISCLKISWITDIRARRKQIHIGVGWGYRNIGGGVLNHTFATKFKTCENASDGPGYPCQFSKERGQLSTSFWVWFYIDYGPWLIFIYRSFLHYTEPRKACKIPTAPLYHFTHHLYNVSGGLKFSEPFLDLETVKF